MKKCNACNKTFEGERKYLPVLWSLSGTGNKKYFSACVPDEGYISDFGESTVHKEIGVRPAMRIITE